MVFLLSLLYSPIVDAVNSKTLKEEAAIAEARKNEKAAAIALAEKEAAVEAKKRIDEAAAAKKAQDAVAEVVVAAKVDASAEEMPKRMLAQRLLLRPFQMNRRASMRLLER